MKKILRKILRVPLESPAPDPVFDPDLDLQFARDLALDHRITFTRASTATFVGSNKLIQSASNNVARFDHDPATGESLGLLIEGQRTNDIRASEDFSDTSFWGVFGGMTVSANQTTAPDGTTTADKLIEHSSGSNGPRIIDSLSNAPFSTDTACVFSCFLKNNDARYAGLAVRSINGSNFNAEFDLQEGVVVSSGKHGNSTFTSVEMKNYGNGWYRCVIIGKTDTSDVSSDMVIVSITDGSGVNSGGYGDNFTGNGSSIFAWGAQFDEATFETSYIPTSGAAATRSKDLCDIPTNTFRFSEKEGSILIETEAFNDAGATHIFYRFHDGSTAESITLLNKSNDTGQHRYQIKTGNSQIVGKNVAKSILQVFRSIVTYKKDNFTFASQGESPSAATSGTPPTGMTELSIGKNHGTANNLNGHIRTLQYFARQLDDETILALSQPSLEPSLSLVFDSSETSFVDTELTR